MKKPEQDLSRRRFLSVGSVVAGASACGSSAHAISPESLLNRPKSSDSIFKQRARADYARSVAAFGGSLSSTVPPEVAARDCGEVHYDILIVGSGYGASITAARLAEKMRPGVRLAVLERGAEWIPGNFPEKLGDLVKESQFKPFNFRRRVQKNPIGLFSLTHSEELTILSGNGLGGGSLINANVAIKPDRETFQQPQWPFALQDIDVLEPYFERAAWELGVQRDSTDRSFKMRAHRMAAEQLRDIGCHFEAAGLAITRGWNNELPILNRQGFWQRNCIDCGDCLTGCNVGAKNTLAMNYLPMARRLGANLFTQCEVRRIYKREGFYTVEYLHRSREPNGDICTETRYVNTRLVVLAAGSLGTNGILLRSQCDQLCFSKSLGRNWTANGDAIGFAQNSDLHPASRGVGVSADNLGPGPTTQANITYPNRPRLHDRVLIQEGAIASVYARLIGALLYDIGLDKTVALVAMGHDGQQGQVVLHKDGEVDVRWPGLSHSDYRQKIRAEIERVAEAHGGRTWTFRSPSDRVGTVHPLGGCGMSDDPRCGVVDNRGRVYDFSCGGSVLDNGEYATHRGLYVCDGSLFPTAVGVNPYFTIAALAERNAQLLTMQPEYSDLFVNS